MKPKKTVLFLLTLSLSSCTYIRSGCFQCFYGNMIVSSCSMEYGYIKEKQVEVSHEDPEEKYYFNVFPITSQEQLNDFYLNTPSLIYDQSERDRYGTLPEDSMYLFFFVQIPQGYDAYKPNNKQKTTPEGTIMITENFYYYESRPEISYSLVNLKENKEKENTSVFSYFYIVDSQYQDRLKIDNLRVLFDFQASS